MNWKKVKFIDAFSDVTGGNQKFKTNDYLAVGKIPVVDQGKELIAGYINDFAAFNDVPVVVFGDHTRILKYIDFPFVLGADGVKILKTKRKLKVEYIQNMPIMPYKKYISQIQVTIDILNG